MNFSKYLERFNYKGDLKPNLTVLKNLQKSHLLNVPFENLDIHYENPIELDLTKIYHKIVLNNRGGFCYELNSLFYTLLQSIGYDTKMISGKVYDSKKDVFGKEYDHLALIVNLDEKNYLVDVGFGEFAMHPLQISLDMIQKDPRGQYIVERFNEEYLLVSNLEGAIKNKKYLFSEKKREFKDFAEICYYHQTDPNSHFTRKKLISMPTENGRITLRGNALKISEGKEVIRKEVFEKKEFGKHLKELFDMDEMEINSE